MRGSLLAVALLVLLGVGGVLAQDNSCAVLVQQALGAVQDACVQTGRNQACYGNISLTATPRERAQDFTFEQQGDLVNVADIDTLRLQSLDPAENIWGIALMKVQANLPDTLPGQNVTFLLFGDVEIQNAVEPTPELATMEITSGGGINVRGGPSTNYAVIGSLRAGETVVANGRNEDASWLRIQVPDSDALGWVFAELVTTEGDTDTLSVVEATDTEIPFTPMQAFYFRTGVGETDCAEAPGDGILIQTPEGAGRINLRANDVDIQLASTAYLQAQPGAAMTVSVVEGLAQVTAQGATVTVPAGAKVEIPLDEDLKAAGEPGDPVPYDETELVSLPVEVLPEEIAIAPPVEEQALEQASQPPPPAGGAVDLNNPAALAGMDLTLFCQMMDQALAEAGMSRAEYLAMLNQVKGMMPADSQAGFQQIEQMLNQCP
ncbi:MAG: SH3 domain-containing protein [Chloroflexi bacterium]|nr:SH3 domain-containing protein [Chloroflexota bacterium]